MNLAIDLSTAAPNVEIAPNSERGGVNLNMPPGETLVSPVWHLGGYRVQFAGLPAGETINADVFGDPVYMKVVAGNTEQGAGQAFPPPGAVTTTRLDEPAVTAATDAILCFITDTPAASATIRGMDELTVSGPLAEHLKWQSFEEKFSAFTDKFNGLEAHMVFGFHLLNADSDEIAYVHFWTAGKGVDVSTHNHAQDPSPVAPAFAEVHLVLRNGTGSGGMYQCDTRDAVERVRTPIQAGEEHGPFFHLDENGCPRRRANGAVDYPWHGWQGGADDSPGQAYDLVAAFEINPDYVAGLA